MLDLIRHFPVYTKKDEMEHKNKKMMNVLASVHTLSSKLQKTGEVLSQISENESVSSAELTTISEQLLEGNHLLSAKTDENMANLGELHEWAGVVAQSVEKAASNSKELLDKSTSNQIFLNTLQTINCEVSESMKLTTDIAEKISIAVQEIGLILNLLNDISDSTDLLALKASIEAARADEAGRGFSGIATEMGHLANSIQQSLTEAKAIIDQVQTNIKDMNEQIYENSSKLDTQNKYCADVFNNMKEMTELLHVSMNAIRTIDESHKKQAEVIQKTVSINQAIAEGIKNENEQFVSIRTLAENYTKRSCIFHTTSS